MTDRRALLRHRRTAYLLAPPDGPDHGEHPDNVLSDLARMVDRTRRIDGEWAPCFVPYDAWRALGDYRQRQLCARAVEQGVALAVGLP